MLVSRTKLALGLIQRQKPEEDLPDVRCLLGQGLLAAEAMGLPEAAQIQGILKKFGIPEEAARQAAVAAGAWF